MATVGIKGSSYTTAVNGCVGLLSRWASIQSVEMWVKLYSSYMLTASMLPLIIAWFVYPLLCSSSVLVS